MFQIIPRETVFFDLFEKAAANVHASSEALIELLESFDDIEARRQKVRALEHVGDELTHQMIERLNKTFITPIDRADIHELACRLDDIIDLVDTAVDRIQLFKIDRPIEEARQLGTCLLRSTALIVEMVPMLRNMKDADVVRQKVLEVHRLESEGDRLERHALKTLFERGSDPLFVIKWKTIVEALEEATDRCEDVANVIEGIVLKNV